MEISTRNELAFHCLLFGFFFKKYTHTHTHIYIHINGKYIYLPYVCYVFTYCWRSIHIPKKSSNTDHLLQKVNWDVGRTSLGRRLFDDILLYILGFLIMFNIRPGQEF